MSKQQKAILIGKDNAHTAFPKGFSQQIYKLCTPPRVLSVKLVFSPLADSSPYNYLGNAFFEFQIYGHDKKSKGKRVCNRCVIPFYEALRLKESLDAVENNRLFNVCYKYKYEAGWEYYTFENNPMQPKQIKKYRLKTNTKK